VFIKNYVDANVFLYYLLIHSFDYSFISILLVVYFLAYKLNDAEDI